MINFLAVGRVNTKIGFSYSSWYDIVRSVLEGSILGPLLFNLFMNDFFFVITMSEECNFADDNTLIQLKEIVRNSV